MTGHIFMCVILFGFVGLMVFSLTIGIIRDRRSNRKKEAEIRQQQKEVQAQVATWKSAAISRQKSRAEIAAELSDERYRLAIAVRKEWLDFEGLNTATLEEQEKRGGFALAEQYLDSVDQRATLTLLYGLGHRPPLNRTATGVLLGRTGSDIGRLEREALKCIEAFLWQKSNPGNPFMRFSKTYKIWLTEEEWGMSRYWKRDGTPLLVARQPENPHPKGISPTNENARQWLQGEAQMVWLRKQNWAAEHLPALAKAARAMTPKLPARLLPANDEMATSKTGTPVTLTTATL